jgi:hypothetical protein
LTFTPEEIPERRLALDDSGRLWVGNGNGTVTAYEIGASATQPATTSPAAKTPPPPAN